MDYNNPFSKRAAEYLRDDADFLSLVTPDSLDFFIKKYAEKDVLFDRLVQIIGTPGSGKTTIARLIKYSTVGKLLALQGSDKSLRPLVRTLHECRILERGRPKVLACRLPMEGEYRDLWEFPYSDEIKSRLMFALLEARAVLAWLNEIELSGISLKDISIIPRTGTHAALESIGGLEAAELQAMARDVESRIYSISAALLPPPYEEIDKSISTLAYRPLDVIAGIKIGKNENAYTTIPLVIFDDAHALHPEQFSSLQRWLLRRELSVARWVMTRLDAMSPKDLLLNQEDDEPLPGVKQSREMTIINFQKETRAKRDFSKMAQGMADRYLRQMPTFSGKRHFSELLDEKQMHLPPGKLKELRERTRTVQQKCHVPDARSESMRGQILKNFKQYASSENEDDLLAILSILFERYAKRTPRQLSLFSVSEEIEPTRMPEITAGVIEGARVHLLGRFDRPLYFGIQDLCAASSENAEQFLQLASELVSLAEAKAIRKHSYILNSKTQHDKLRTQATTIINNWNFPNCNEVRKLVFAIAAECKEKSLEGNASLDGGAIAIGIEQEYFDKIPESNPQLARILKYAIAYNAFSLVPNYKTKHKIWCLLELNGVALLHFGLTLKRGGFLERDVAYLNKILGQ